MSDSINTYQKLKTKRFITIIKNTSYSTVPALFVVSGMHTHMYAFKGYNVEIGTSIFAFSDFLNEKNRY